MNDLIAALTIFAKYEDPEYTHSPTHCEHDVLYIANVKPDKVSAEDDAKLQELSFFVGNGTGESMYQSFRFGSA